MLAVFAEHLKATTGSVLDELDLQPLQAEDNTIKLGQPRGALVLTACAVSHNQFVVEHITQFIPTRT